MMPEVRLSMALECGVCNWRPSEDLTQGLIKAHFETEHGTEEVMLKLRAICPCGAAMTFLHSKYIGLTGEIKDHKAVREMEDRFWCPQDGSMGGIRRKSEDA